VTTQLENAKEDKSIDASIEHILNLLIKQLSHEIISNSDMIPHKEFNVISTEEYRHLKKIEALYNKLLSLETSS
jgi:hypothetical protein